MKRSGLAGFGLVWLCGCAAGAGGAPPAAGDLSKKVDALAEALAHAEHRFDELAKKIDDVLWFERVGDVAEVDKVFIPTVPHAKGEETYGIANERHPFRMWSYVFVPRGEAPAGGRPLVLLPHGGVHADFDTYYTHIVRELIAQGYVVVAPEYRGSTGYEKDYWEAIDYGGEEVADVVAARDWAVGAVPGIDAARVAIIGWSHGGLIALLAVMREPAKFQVAYAGVPVSDLVARLGYQTDDYRALYAAPYHIGKTPYEDVDEYRRRSPAWQAAKLTRPLLIHTTTNDRDVHVSEVEHLIAQLTAAGKQFRHRIYDDAPGGHSFNRVDTPLARESRAEIWAFLAEHLK